MLSSAHAQEKAKNRAYLLKVIQSVRYLARQGLALHGDGDEKNSNLFQLLQLTGFDDPAILEFLQRRQTNVAAHAFKMSYSK